MKIANSSGFGKAIGKRALQRRGIKTALGAALTAAAIMNAPAAIAAVQVTNVQLAGPGTYYTVQINGENVYDAALVLTIDGAQVLANCDDIYHYINIGQKATFSASDFTAAANPADFHGGNYSASQIGAMSWLLDKSAAIWKTGPADAHEQLDLAALQLASWMVGNPTAVFSNYDADVYSLAQSYMMQSAGKSAFPGTSVQQLTSSTGVQGQLVTSAVPEPSSWMLMLAGFGVIGYATRKSANMRRRTVAYA